MHDDTLVVDSITTTTALQMKHIAGGHTGVLEKLHVTERAWEPVQHVPVQTLQRVIVLAHTWDETNTWP